MAAASANRFLGDLDVLPSIARDLTYGDLLEEFADRPKDRHALLFLRETLAQQS
jgi:hypothetical protein